jgi:hypothetical protein
MRQGCRKVKSSVWVFHDRSTPIVNATLHQGFRVVKHYFIFFIIDAEVSNTTIMQAFHVATFAFNDAELRCLGKIFSVNLVIEELHGSFHSFLHYGVLGRLGESLFIGTDRDLKHGFVEGICYRAANGVSSSMRPKDLDGSGVMQLQPFAEILCREGFFPYRYRYLEIRCFRVGRIAVGLVNRPAVDVDVTLKVAHVIAHFTSHPAVYV